MRCIPLNSKIKIMYGLKTWCKNDTLHSFNDQPSYGYACGDKCWYTEGKLNRGEGKPAVICGNGFKRWYIDGVRIKEQEIDGSIRMYEGS